MLAALAAWLTVELRGRREQPTVVIRRGSIRQTVAVIGTVAPARRVSIWPEASGRVHKIHVALGDPVKQGQLLAEISNPFISIELKRRELALERAAWNAKQQHGDENSDARTDFDLRQARLELDYAQAQNAGLSIRTPISGTVVGLPLREGEQVGTTGVASAIVIAADGDRVVQAEADESELAGVRKNDPTVLTIEGVTLQGIVSNDPVIVRISTGPLVPARIAVTIKILEAAQHVRVGVSATASIMVADHRDVVLSPLSAIEMVDDRSYIFVKDRGGVQRRQVRLGAVDGNNAELLSGVVAGEVVLLEIPTDATVGANAG